MQYLIKVVDGIPIGNPILLNNLKQVNTDIAAINKSFILSSDVEPFGYNIFVHTTPPENSDPTKQYVETIPTEKNTDGEWLQKWELVPINFTSAAERDRVIEEALAFKKLAHNQSITEQLTKIDLKSIRVIREWIVLQPSASQLLKDYDTEYASLLAQLEI